MNFIKAILRCVALGTMLVLLSASSLAQEAPVPKQEPLLIVSSWYGEPFHGRTMANGKVYDKMKLTVAHRAWPFQTKLRLLNPTNNRAVEVVVTDRGPYVNGRGLDVSEKVAMILGFHKKGIEILEVHFIDD